MTRRPLPASVQAAVDRQLAKGAPKIGKLQQAAMKAHGAKPKRGKYNAHRSTVSPEEAHLSGGMLIAGESFDSDLERTICVALRARYTARRVMRQVSVTLPGGVRMRPDFVILRDNAPALWLDAKGMIKQDWINKRKQLLAAHGIDVVPITSPGQVKSLPE